MSSKKTRAITSPVAQKQSVSSLSEARALLAAERKQVIPEREHVSVAQQYVFIIVTTLLSVLINVFLVSRHSPAAGYISGVVLALYWHFAFTTFVLTFKSTASLSLRSALRIVTHNKATTQFLALLCAITFGIGVGRALMAAPGNDYAWFAATVALVTLTLMCDLHFVLNDVVVTEHSDESELSFFAKRLNRIQWKPGYLGLFFVAILIGVGLGNLAMFYRGLATAQFDLLFVTLDLLFRASAVALLSVWISYFISHGSVIVSLTQRVLHAFKR